MEKYGISLLRLTKNPNGGYILVKRAITFPMESEEHARLKVCVPDLGFGKRNLKDLKYQEESTYDDSYYAKGTD